MSKKSLGLLVAAIGLVMALVTALADMLGLGKVEGTFGYNQILGTVVGVAVLLVGLRIRSKASSD